MTVYVLIILLALLWLAMWGAINFYALAVGLVIGAVLLLIVRRGSDADDVADLKPWRVRLRLLVFMGYFLRIMFLSNWVVAKIVLTPGFHQKPRLIRYPVDGLTDTQVTTLANTFTLTPGTLSIDVSQDRKWLYVHCMIGQDREAAIRDLDTIRQRVMREVF